MWLEFIEGFDWPGDSAELQDRYVAGAWDLMVGEGADGSNAGWDPDGTYYVFSSFGQTEILMGFRCKTPLTNSSMIEFRNNSTTQIALKMTPEGRLTIYRGAAWLAQSDKTCSADDWHYIEIQLKIGNAPTGLYNVWVDGVLFLDDTGVDTEGMIGGCGNVEWPVYGGTWDDMYLYLGAGASAATPLGDITVPAFLVNAAGDDAQWTPSAGANYENVDDPIADEDATYNEDAVAGQRDLYNFADLAAFSGDIKGVEVLARLRKTDVGAKQAKIACKSGGSLYYGPDLAMSDSYAWFSQVWEVDPDTAADWLRAGFNAGQFGAEVVS